jgi:hypothetical protein
LNHTSQFVKLSQLDKTAFHYKGHYTSENKLYEYSQTNKPLVGYNPDPTAGHLWEKHQEVTPDNPEFHNILSSGTHEGLADIRANFQKARDKKRNIIIGASAAGAAVASVAVPLMFRNVRKALHESTERILREGKFMKKANALDYVAALRMEKTGGAWGNFGKAFMINPLKTMWNAGKEAYTPMMKERVNATRSLNPEHIRASFEPELKKMTSESDLVRRAHERLGQRTLALQKSVEKKPGIIRQIMDPHGEKGRARLEKANAQYDRGTARLQEMNANIGAKKNEMTEQMNAARPQYEQSFNTLHKDLRGMKFKRKVADIAGRTATIGIGGAALYGGAKVMGNQQPQYQQPKYAELTNKIRQNVLTNLKGRSHE